MSCPSRISSSRSQRVGLVHDVAGDQQRGAGVGEPVEELPQVAAQHRVEPDGRLVEHQQLGLADQRDGEARPASAGRRRACRPATAAWLVEVDRVDAPGRRRRAAAPSIRAK